MIFDTFPLGSDDERDDQSDDEFDDEREDAVALLITDHEVVRQLFAQYDEFVDDADDEAARTDLARLICAALTAHTTIEEELFYPAARDALGDDELLDNALTEHTSTKELISQLELMEAGDDLFDATMRMLREVVDHHIEEEEAWLFPQMQDSNVDLFALGEQLAQRRQEVLAEIEVHQD